MQAGGRVYWVNPAGAFVPALGHWSQVVQYLDLATGKIGTAGRGQTVFLSAGGRYLLMSQTATSLTETPVAGGASRQLTLPRGWYLPGGDGLPDVGSGEGLATANGIIVQSAESSAWRARALGLWNPRSGKVEVIGRELAVIGAYTPPGGRYSLLAWLPAACPFPDNCLLKITNTATLTARTVRSPLPGGFAAGGAFSPGGTRLAVFLNNSPSRAAGWRWPTRPPGPCGWPAGPGSRSARTLPGPGGCPAACISSWARGPGTATWWIPRRCRPGRCCSRAATATAPGTARTSTSPRPSSRRAGDHPSRPARTARDGNTPA